MFINNLGLVTLLLSFLDLPASPLITLKIYASFKHFHTTICCEYLA